MISNLDLSYKNSTKNFYVPFPQVLKLLALRLPSHLYIIFIHIFKKLYYE